MCVCVWVCVCVHLPTIVFAYEAGGRVGQGRGAPAVSLPGASCVAVLPTFLLQLLEPIMHHLPAGSLETHTHTHTKQNTQHIHEVTRGNTSQSRDERLKHNSNININRMTPGLGK